MVLVLDWTHIGSCLCAVPINIIPTCVCHMFMAVPHSLIYMYDVKFYNIMYTHVDCCRTTVHLHVLVYGLSPLCSLQKKLCIYTYAGHCLTYVFYCLVPLCTTFLIIILSFCLHGQTAFVQQVRIVKCYHLLHHLFEFIFEFIFSSVLRYIQYFPFLLSCITSNLATRPIASFLH